MFTFCSSILNVKCLEIHFPRRGPAAGHRRASSAVSEAGGGCVVAPVGQADCHGPPCCGPRTVASPAAGAGPGCEGALIRRVCHLKFVQDAGLGDCLALESASNISSNTETDRGQGRGVAAASGELWATSAQASAGCALRALLSALWERPSLRSPVRQSGGHLTGGHLPARQIRCSWEPRCHPAEGHGRPCAWRINQGASHVGRASGAALHRGVAVAPM